MNTNPYEAIAFALRAIEEGWSFDRIDNEVGPRLRLVLAHHALDQMAENAKELGLDYEPPLIVEVKEIKA